MRIVVIGGGVTGLAVAHRLLELAAERGRTVEVLLLEAGRRLGGLIGSERRDGFLIETGPDAFITDKPWALALCRRLRLDDQLVETNAACRRSFVAVRGRLRPIPAGFQVLAPGSLPGLRASSVLSRRGRIRAAFDLVLPPRPPAGDESVGSFVRRRFGEEALLRLAGPMVAGIYGADPDDLSLAATLPRFRDMEQEHGSVVRAIRARAARDGGAAASGARYGLFVSFREGMQTLVDALAARLPAGSARLGARVVGLRRTSGQAGVWELDLDGGERVTPDGVCLAVPAHAAARLASETDPTLGDLLGGISYASSTTINLAYRRQDVPHPLDGFGFVVPALERRAILGCTFASVKFPGRAPAGAVLLRVFFGHGFAERHPRDLERLARSELGQFLGIRAEPLRTTCHAWPSSMPHYRVGHLNRVAAIEARAAALPSFALAGNAYRGVGIPDAIRSGEAAAEALLASDTGVA